MDKLYVLQEKLRNENDHFRSENLILSSKVELMKSIMLEFDVQRLEDDQEEQVIYQVNELVPIRAIDDREPPTQELASDLRFLWY
jgi:hypothetical protein